MTATKKPAAKRAPGKKADPTPKRQPSPVYKLTPDVADFLLNTVAANLPMAPGDPDFEETIEFVEQAEDELPPIIDGPDEGGTISPELAQFFLDTVMTKVSITRATPNWRETSRLILQVTHELTLIASRKKR